MSGKNKVILIGNMGKDPVTRKTKNGKPVTNFSLAVNGRGKDDDTTWFEVSCWNGLAESVSKYGAKGRKVYVEGTISLDDREYNGKRYVNLKVTAFDVTFLDKPRDAGVAVDDDDMDELAF